MCSNDNAFRTHARDAAPHASGTVAASVPHHLEYVRIAEVGAVPDCADVLAVQRRAGKKFPIFRAVDDALHVAVHARGQVGGVACGDNGEIGVTAQGVGRETAGGQLAFPVAGRHGQHEARGTSGHDIGKEGVQLGTDFLMHPSHLVAGHGVAHEGREATPGQRLPDVGKDGWATHDPAF